MQWLFLAALGVPLGYVPVLAQTPAQRTVLEAFRDSLSRVGDSVDLSRVEATMVSAMRNDRANAFEHLRLGFLALRQADLGAVRYFDDAASEFQTVTRLAPAWPYAWFGLGLAEYGLVRPAPAQKAASTRYIRASVALAKAAMIDGRFADLIVEEAEQARRQAQQPKIGVMLVALRVAAQPRTSNPMILVGLGRLEREFGEPENALQAFERWLPVSARQRGLALLEIARTRLLLRRADGVAPYFEGAVFDDSATVQAYRGDIALIASSTELQGFDRASGPARVGYLRSFWARRDAADLRPPGERLREHYRRVYYARRTFPLLIPGRSADYIAASDADAAVDDRGLIYIRHGEPDDRVELTTLGVEPNESWRYVRAEGDMVLHFVARHDPSVFRLVESLLDVTEKAQAKNPSTGDLVSRGTEAVLRSRERISAVYRRDRRATPERGRDFLLAERAMSRASLRLATTTDSYRDRFPRGLDARVDFAVFDLDPGGARLHVAYALPFTQLAAAWLGQRVEYPLRLRLAAFTDEGVLTAKLDTTVRPVAWEVFGERWVAGTLAIPVRTGRMRVRIAIQDGDSVGTVLPLRSFEVPAGGEFAMSDIAVGVAAEPWYARPGTGERVALLPLGTLKRTDRAELAYEVTAPPGAAVQSQVTIMRADERAGVVSNEQVKEPVQSGRQLVRHVLALHKLKPGLYRIEVTVTDGRGGLARRWKEFELR